MINHTELFKDLEISKNQHISAIDDLLGDDKEAVLVLTSMQGRSKTTAMINEFVKYPNSIFLTQSTKRMNDNILPEIRHWFPGFHDFRTIKGMEAVCSTLTGKNNNDDEEEYYGKNELLELAYELRKIGILTDDIHKIICDDPNCDYLSQDKEFSGRIIETVKRFHMQITLGRKFSDLYKRIIFIDEADGLLNMESTVLTGLPYESELIFQETNLLPAIFRVKAPSDEIKKLMKKYRNLISDIDENEEEIKITTDLIRILTEGYFTIIKGKIHSLPSIFYIFLSVLEHEMKLILGSATMRNHRLNFYKLQAYYITALELVLSEKTDRITEKYNSEAVAYLSNLRPEVREFYYNFEKEPSKIYYLPNPNHSFSISHYKKIKTDDKILKRTFAEIRIALDFYRAKTNHEPEKILLICLSELERHIKKYLKNLKKTRHGNRNTLFKNMEFKRFFSNEMHGINADKEGYDLIITIGDPLDSMITKYSDTLGAGQLLKKGFSIRSDTNKEMKEMLIRTMLSELLEAFHRGRGRIPIIAIGNFLSLPDSKEITNKIMKENGFQIESLYLNVWNEYKTDISIFKKEDLKLFFD